MRNTAYNPRSQKIADELEAQRNELQNLVDENRTKVEDQTDKVD